MPNLVITQFGQYDFDTPKVYAIGGDNAAKEASRNRLEYTVSGAPFDPYGSDSWPLEYREFNGDFLLTGSPIENNALLEALEQYVGTVATVTGRIQTSPLFTRSIEARLMRVDQVWSAPRMDGVEQWHYITAVFQAVGDWS